MTRLNAAIVTIALAVLAAACGGGGSKAPTPVPTATKVATPFTADRATTLIESVLLAPKDLPEAGWTVSSDTTQDNAAAAAADPATAASNERCGRLLGRTLTMAPPNSVTAFIGGETVAFFSQVTAYATEAGASDCAAEAATKLQQPGQLARAFGKLFIDPDKLVIAPVEYPTTADGSFAVTLAGQVSAQGFTIDLTLLVVGFRKGNVTAVVGSARNGTPPVAELTPLVDEVLQRIGAAEQ
jgi:hypothetical protein